MEHQQHSMTQLFEQLGLPSDPQAIAAFIAQHRPLRGEVKLHEADFWSASQASLLREAIVHDADWAEVTDALNAALHAEPPPP
jgi:hypothetical protein